MRRPFTLIICVLAILNCGCQESQKTPKASANRIKLADIAPKHKEKLPPAVNFKIFTFEMPAQHYPAFAGAFSALHPELIHYANREAFQNNGFQAGLGRGEAWGFVGERLRLAKAKKTATSTILNYGDTPNDLYVNDIIDNTTISYISIKGNSEELMQPPGTAAVWRFSTNADSERRGTTQLKLEAYTVEPVNSVIARLPQNEGMGENLFKPASMVMRISEGDFILLGPAQGYLPATTEKPDFTDPEKTISLSELFFIRWGSFTVPKENPDLPDEDAETKSVDKEAFYDVKKDIPLVRVFIISCAGVQN